MAENIRTFLTDEDGKVINSSIDNIADWKEVFDNLTYKGERADREWLGNGDNGSIGDCYFVVYNPQVSLDNFSPYFVVCCNTLQQNGEKRREWKRLPIIDAITSALNLQNIKWVSEEIENEDGSPSHKSKSVVRLTFTDGGTCDLPLETVVEEELNKLNKKIELLHNVKEFGAVGDGESDDTVAIQNALNAGGIVFFPPGRYKTTKTLYATTPCTIKMCSPYPSVSGLDLPDVRETDGVVIGASYGARIETYANRNANDMDGCGLIIGDSVDVDGLYIRAMVPGIISVVKYEGKKGCKNYPAQNVLKNIRIDNATWHVCPEHMFNFHPYESYGLVIENVLIGSNHTRQFCKYGFYYNIAVDSPTNDSDMYTNGLTLRNIKTEVHATYPMFIDAVGKIANGWNISNVQLQRGSFSSYPEGCEVTEHQSMLVIRGLWESLITGCKIWDSDKESYVPIKGNMIEQSNNVRLTAIGNDEYFNELNSDKTTPLNFKGVIEPNQFDAVTEPLIGDTYIVEDVSGENSDTIHIWTNEGMWRAFPISSTNEVVEGLNILVTSGAVFNYVEDRLNTKMTYLGTLNQTPTEAQLASLEGNDGDIIFNSAVPEFMIYTGKDFGWMSIKASEPTTLSYEEQLKNADLNSDGAVDIKDALRLHQLVNNQISKDALTDEELVAADINMDGKIDEEDSDLLFNYVASPTETE